jgi:hypothetical protein
VNKLSACSPADTNAERAVGWFTRVRAPGRELTRITPMSE